MAYNNGKGEMAMTLKQLEYVVKVAECGTVSGAAKALFVAQPSLI